MSGYANSEVSKTPETESLALSETPVLYQTSTVTGQNYTQTQTSSDIVKNWYEGTSTGGGWSNTTLTFVNNAGWSAVRAHYWNGSNTLDIDLTRQDNTNTWSADVSAAEGYPNMLFQNGANAWNGGNQTANQSSSTGLVNAGFGKTFTSGSNTNVSNYIVFDFIDKNHCSWIESNHDIYASFYTSAGEDGGWLGNVKGNDFSYDGHLGAWWSIPDTATKVRFYNSEKGYQTNIITFTVGEFYKSYNNSNPETTTHYGNPSTIAGQMSNITGTWSGAGATYNPGTQQVAYTSTYQPEDRYGYISSINGTSDEDNFIYFDTSANTSYEPYVKFYTNNDGSGTTYEGVKTSDSSAANIKTDLAGTNLYRIRLPKNAKYFKIADGIDGTLSSSYIPLEEDVTITQGTGASAVDVSVENFRHAGTTFAFDSSGNASVQSLRSGFTPVKDTMADPLDPKTDADFVFFTDTNNTFANSGKVYAYFYGAADGEYMVSPTQSWPGIKASTDNEDLADTTYTDNAGNTVYMFRIPKGNEGTYSQGNQFSKIRKV